MPAAGAAAEWSRQPQPTRPQAAAVKEAKVSRTHSGIVSVMIGRDAPSETKMRPRVRRGRLRSALSCPSIAAEMRSHIGRDGLRLIRGRNRTTCDHIGDNARPISLRPLDHGDALKVMTDRTARLYQLFAGAAGQRDVRGRLRPRSEIH